MHEYRVDIIHYFVWLVFSKLLSTYTDIHIPSISLFWSDSWTQWKMFPDLNRLWSVSHSQSLRMQTCLLFPGATLISGNSKREKQTPFLQWRKQAGKKLHLCRCIWQLISFFTASYEMFHLMYHIFLYLLILIIC